MRRGFDQALSPIAFSWDPQPGQSLPSVVSFSRASTGTYISPTTGLVVTAAIDEPRITADGLLLEIAATNVIRRSEEISNATWLKQGSGVAAPTVTADQGTAPDGNLTADRVQIQASSGNASHYSFVEQSFTVGSTGRYSLSFWAKSFDGSSSYTTYMSFYTGTTWVNQQITITGTWQRFVFEDQNLTAATWLVAIGNARGMSGSGQNGQSAADILLWGVQAERQRAATSYIPTASGAAARGQDICSFPHGLTAADSNWSFAADITPASPGTGWPSSNSNVFLIGSSYVAADSAYLVVNGSTQKLEFGVIDTAAAARSVPETQNQPNTKTRVFARAAQGVLSVNYQGSTSGSPSGAGTGLLTTVSPNLLLSDSTAGVSLFGFIRNIVIARTAAGAQ